MDKRRFRKDFPALFSELHEFQYTEEADEVVARRLIANPQKNPREALVATARALVEESARVLRDFDLRWEEFVEASNLASLEEKPAARKWLEKMNRLWTETLRELESKA